MIGQVSQLLRPSLRTSHALPPLATACWSRPIRSSLRTRASSLWKPMHLQPLHAQSSIVGGGVAEDLYVRGLCVPSGPNRSEADLETVVAVVLRTAARKFTPRATIGSEP